MNIEEIKGKVTEADSPDKVGLLSSQAKEYLSELIGEDNLSEALSISENLDQAINEKIQDINALLDALYEVNGWNGELLGGLQKANEDSIKKAQEKEKYKSDPNGLLNKKLGQRKHSSLGGKLRGLVMKSLPKTDDGEN